jgi:hypothetical protein
MRASKITKKKQVIFNLNLYFQILFNLKINKKLHFILIIINLEINK